MVRITQETTKSELDEIEVKILESMEYERDMFMSLMNTPNTLPNNKVMAKKILKTLDEYRNKVKLSHKTFTEMLDSLILIDNDRLDNSISALLSMLELVKDGIEKKLQMIYLNTIE